MNQEEILEKLTELMQQQNQLSFKCPAVEHDIEALGIMVSKLVGFQPSAIIEVLLYALTDANAHDEVEKISEVTRVKMDE